MKHKCKCGSNMLKMPTTELTKYDESEFTLVYDLGRRLGGPLRMSKEDFKKEYGGIREILLIPYQCGSCGFKQSYRE
uniref:Uncharacterized protein n=1 Tax=viral metagenome TaxID=1070528 RepID=A0A6M3KEB0_9ZZZZ